MQGLMMDYPLTVNSIFRRAEALAGRQEIVSRLADTSIHRYKYAAFADRTRRLARALKDLGLKPGDRVATLGWNHAQHLEAYFGIPLAGGILHTLNLRLHPDELAFIINDADDQVVLVDHVLMPLWAKIAPSTHVRHTVVVGVPGEQGSETGRAMSPDSSGIVDYETLLRASEPLDDQPDPDERTAAAMCYTTGTTGKPKGVLYSHRALVLHSFASSLSSCLGI